MRIFLSWSGELSKSVAKAFHDWLPHVIQDAEPWMSSEDVGKGETWLSNIKDAITASRGVGLFFLTQKALSSGWLLFEAGGIAAIDAQRVCTVCVDLDPSHLTPPLSFFQATKLEEDDVYRLLQSLNTLFEKPLSPNVLQASFDRTCLNLQTSIAKATENQELAVTSKAEKAPTVSDLTAILDGIRRVEARLGTVEQQQRSIGYSRMTDMALSRLDERKGSPIDLQSPTAEIIAAIAAGQRNPIRTLARVRADANAVAQNESRATVRSSSAANGDQLKPSTKPD